MPDHDTIPPEVLAEAAAIANYALDLTLPLDDADLFHAVVADPYLAHLFLAVGGHVSDLRREFRPLPQQSPLTSPTPPLYWPT